MYYNELDDYYKIDSNFIPFSNNNIDYKEYQIKKIIEIDKINQNKINQNKINQNKINENNKKKSKEFDINNIIIYQYEPLTNREEYQADIGYFSPYYLISNLFQWYLNNIKKLIDSYKMTS